MKDKIQLGVTIVIIALMLFVYEMAASGDFRLTEENISEIPSTLIKATAFGYIKVYGRTFGKKVARIICKPFVKTVNSIWSLKSWINENKKTKALDKYLIALNLEKKLDMAQKKARLVIEKDKVEIAKLTRAIKMKELNGKKHHKLTNKKTSIELKVKAYDLLWNLNKKGKPHLDKPTEALMWKLTKNFKEITSADLYIQTPNKFDKWDVTTSDKKGSTISFAMSIINAMLFLMITSGLVLEAQRAESWEAWVSLLILWCFAGINLWSGFEAGKKIVLHKELPTRMNALSILQMFVDEEAIVKNLQLNEEIKKEDN